MRRIHIIALIALALLCAGGLWLYTPDRPRAVLEAIYADPPSRFVEVLGLRVHLRDSGAAEAPAVILLHGFGSGLHTWDDWVPALQPGRRVVRLDLPGFGLTGPDPSGDYTDARTLAVLAALMDRLGIARADLIGHSMGGRFAWKFAALHPERVRRLVLISPDGFANPDQGYGQAQAVPTVMELLPYVMPTPMLRMTLAPAFGDPARMTQALLARYRDMMLAPGVRGAILERTRQNILIDPVPLLRRIAAPTLLLWGERDQMVPFDNSADYLAAIPEVRLVALPGLGHVAMEEAPAETIRPVLEFLALP